MGRLISVVYVDVECLNEPGKMSPPLAAFDSGNPDNPYLKLYHKINEAVTSNGCGQLCTWGQMSGGDGYRTYLINCWDEDKEEVVKFLSGVVADVTDPKVIRVEAEEESWEQFSD